MTVDEKALREAVDRAARTARSHSHHALWAGLPTDSLERFGIALAQRIESAIRSNAYEVAKAPAPKPAPSPAAVQGSGATVKPIDWRDMTYKGVEEWLGHCALSQSFTIKDEGPLHEGSEYRFVVRPILSGRTSFPTADEAKAAAQADYEQRIRSALYPAPTSESEAEQFIQAAVDSAPEPLRRLGEWLAGVLDEDDWKTAERMLIGAALANPGTAAGDVREALESVAPYLDAIVCYASTISEHDGNRVAKLVRAALSASASAPGSGVPEGFALVPVDALRWLNGEHEDGFEKPEAARGNFWWRTEFKRRCAASPPPHRERRSERR